MLNIFYSILYRVAALPPSFRVINPYGRFGVQPKNCRRAYNLCRSASYRLAAFVAQRRKNSDGSILELGNVISLRCSFHGARRNVKLLASGDTAKSKNLPRNLRRSIKHAVKHIYLF